MSRNRPLPAAFASHAQDVPGSGHLDALRPAFDRVDAWAGGALAVIVGGSHASGEAVWVEHDGRRVSLSDLDVYAVVPDRARQRAARARARDDAGAADARASGLLGPIEAAFLTPQDLAALPARPATLELRRHGHVVRGDPAWHGRVPDHAVRAVDAEERLLLLENRAFELLLAWDGLAAPDVLTRLQARHAVLKTALDLATVAVLERGAYPDGARARVALATTAGASPALVAVWARALAWREAPPAALEPPAGRAEWREAAIAWAEAWRHACGAFAPAGDPASRVLRCAARARLRRRLRHALTFHARSGRGPSLGDRLRHALGGTPAHRVNGAAVALLLDAAGVLDGSTHAAPPAIGETARGLLRRLGFGAAAASDWDAASRAIVRAWDDWVLDGRRTAGAA